MITMMSLAKMRPGQGDLDPRLYQYGGLWIYPVGAMLKAASRVASSRLRGGARTRLLPDKPEAFAGSTSSPGCNVVAGDCRRAGRSSRIVRAIQRASLSRPSQRGRHFMPVVVNMAHEAKPHLPGMVLMLLAVMAARGTCSRAQAATPG
jgi:hypothetical protein